MRLKIGSVEVTKYISSFGFSQKTRGENVSYSISGNAYIDRFGGVKATINIVFGIVEYSDWENIKEVLENPSFDTEYAVNGSPKTGTFRCASEISTNIIYGDSPYYVAGMQIALEEL